MGKVESKMVLWPGSQRQSHGLCNVKEVESDQNPGNATSKRKTRALNEESDLGMQKPFVAYARENMCKAQFSLQTPKTCSLKHVEIPRYQFRSILGI